MISTRCIIRSAGPTPARVRCSEKNKEKEREGGIILHVHPSIGDWFLATHEATKASLDFAIPIGIKAIQTL